VVSTDWLCTEVEVSSAAVPVELSIVELSTVTDEVSLVGETGDAVSTDVVSRTVCESEVKVSDSFNDIDIAAI